MNIVSTSDWSYDLNGVSGAHIDRRALARLGAGLRGIYKDVTEEPVPESLAEFIRELERRERKPAERSH